MNKYREKIEKIKLLELIFEGLNSNLKSKKQKHLDQYIIECKSLHDLKNLNSLPIDQLSQNIDPQHVKHVINDYIDHVNNENNAIEFEQYRNQMEKEFIVPG